MEESIMIAEEADYPEILDLQKKAFHIVAKTLGNPDIPPLRQTLDGIREDAQDHTILKYVSGGRIVGTVRAKMLDSGNCYVAKLAVDPGYHNRGIGRKLLAAIEEYFPDCRAFELFTSMDTPNTGHLYRSAGYEVARICTDDVGVTLLCFLKKNQK
jgi:ribosomal protein S18 acetylase RimI-like enzyme